VGYPKWWEDFKQKNHKATTVVGIVQTTSNVIVTPEERKKQNRKSFMEEPQSLMEVKEERRIPAQENLISGFFDCGATDTMTHDPHDFSNLSAPVKTHIETTNGELVAVQGAGSIVFSKELKLENCLYVPALSSKLISISQITKEMNCVVLMFPTFCLLQDILTKEIIGRDTERGGLYYVDKVAHKGHVMLAHGTVTRQLWLCHRHLGHPSFGYLKILFPSLFTSNTELIKCETCIRAKNHRVTFPPNNNRVNSTFSLVHSDVWGPAPNSHNNQFQYFLLFVDDFSRMTWVYFLKHKYEVPD